MKKLFKNGICLLFAAVVFFGIAVTARAEENISLPDEYIAVEYVESHGQEWIDTNFIPTDKTRSEIDFCVTVDSPASSMGIYGAYKNSRHQVFYTLASDTMTYGVGTGASYTSLDANRHYAVLDAKNAFVSVDGIMLESNNGKKYSSKAATASAYIFGAHQPDNYSSYAKIYEVKIYEDDMLMHHFVPCYAKGLMEYGMYELIEGKFYGNSSGAGNLTGPENKNGFFVSFSVPNDVTLKVYSGFAEKSTGALAYSYSETSENETKYYYRLPVGKYHFVSQGTGYYILHKNFIVTKEDLENGKKIIDANPKLTSKDKKYDYSKTYSRALFSFTDELLNSDLTNVNNLLEQFPGILNTPAFSEEKAFAQFTSQQDMENFIFSFDNENDNMKIFTVGKTGNKKNIYLTVHTKENLDEKSIEEASEIIKSGKKPTVCIFGLIHGLEPSGGEGTLALIKALDGEYGEKVLEKVNIIIVPWVNGDGAERYMYGTPSGCSNLNRYQLMVDYPEIQATHFVYNLFMPEVVISAHEKGINTNGAFDESGTFIDASLDISVNRNNSEEICTLSKNMMKWVIEASAEEGFRMDRHEQDNVSGQYPIIDCNYFGLRGSISFLIEVPGIRAGKDIYGRRVASQFVAAKNIIQYVCENTEYIKSTVEYDREFIAKRGTIFNPDNLITLRHGKNETSSWVINTPVYNLTDGTVKDPHATTSVVFWENSLTVRSCPTAYVVSANSENIDYILRNMEYNNINYYYLSENNFVLLKKYYGTIEEAFLEEEKLCCFENGAYVFPMNQPSANALAMLMEPDVYKTDSYAISLAQGEKLAVNEIYRCEQNLIDGKIPIKNILFGDINLDGKVNTIDANYARRYAAGLLTLDERQKLAADVSGDGEINVMDSSLIRRYVVRYIDSFPAENK